MKHLILNISHAAILIAMLVMVIASGNFFYAVYFAAGYMMHAFFVASMRKAK